MQIITHINNAKCLEWGLNANQGALFDMLNQSASWAKTIVIDGEVWYWVSRNKVIEELPLYYTKPDTVYRHLKALDKSGLVRHQKQGDKDLIMLTEKGKTWNNKVADNLPQNNSKNDDKNSSETNPTLGNKSENTRIEIRNSSDSNPTYQHTNSSAVNNQEKKQAKNPPDEKSEKPKPDIPKTHEQAKAVIEKISKAKKTDYDLVIDKILSLHGKIPQPQKITDGRKAAIKQCLKNHGLEMVLEMLDKVAQSPMTSQGWFGFDFMWKDSPKSPNFLKIIEGNYDHCFGNGNTPPPRREKNISTEYEEWTSPHWGVSS